MFLTRVRVGLRRLIGLLIDPVGPKGTERSRPRQSSRLPVRGAWESACGWEARWNMWLASPTSPMWRGDGQERGSRA